MGEFQNVLRDRLHGAWRDRDAPGVDACAERLTCPFRAGWARCTAQSNTRAFPSSTRTLCRASCASPTLTVRGHRRKNAAAAVRGSGLTPPPYALPFWFAACRYDLSGRPRESRRARARELYRIGNFVHCRTCAGRVQRTVQGCIKCRRFATARAASAGCTPRGPRRSWPAPRRTAAWAWGAAASGAASPEPRACAAGPHALSTTEGPVSRRAPSPKPWGAVVATYRAGTVRTTDHDAAASPASRAMLPSSRPAAATARLRQQRPAAARVTPAVSGRPRAKQRPSLRPYPSSVCTGATSTALTPCGKHSCAAGATVLAAAGLPVAAATSAAMSHTLTTLSRDAVSSTAPFAAKAPAQMMRAWALVWCTRSSYLWFIASARRGVGV